MREEQTFAANSVQQAWTTTAAGQGAMVVIPYTTTTPPNPRLNCEPKYCVWHQKRIAVLKAEVPHRWPVAKNMFFSLVIITAHTQNTPRRRRRGGRQQWPQQTSACHWPSHVGNLLQCRDAALRCNNHRRFATVSMQYLAVAAILVASEHRPALSSAFYKLSP